MEVEKEMVVGNSPCGFLARLGHIWGHVKRGLVESQFTSLILPSSLYTAPSLPFFVASDVQSPLRAGCGVSIQRCCSPVGNGWATGSLMALR